MRGDQYVRFGLKNDPLSHVGRLTNSFHHPWIERTAFIGKWTDEIGQYLDQIHAPRSPRLLGLGRERMDRMRFKTEALEI